MSHILLLEPDTEVRTRFAGLLRQHGHSVAQAATLGDARALDPGDHTLVVTALTLADGLGTDLVTEAGDVPVVITATNTSMRSAIDAMRLGAADFLPLPCDPEELLLCLQRVLRDRQLRRQNDALRRELERRRVTGSMIGSSPAMQGLFHQLTKVAPTDSTVLILGESGTGKELVARALHDGSHRRDAPLVNVNCAAIPENLVESELFGHVRGAFTGASNSRQGLVEAADGGTLFLDEIGELPLDAQARLLRVLQEGEVRRVGSVDTRRVDVRLLAATHRDLRSLIKSGGFREDLYFRLHVLRLELPPLRDRGDDVLELAQAILLRICQRMGRAALALDEATLAVLRAYQWPGNVRELENALERAVILCEGNTITPDLLAIETAESELVRPDDADDADDPLSLEDYFVKFVREHEDQLTETELAAQLGISRKSLWERRQRLGIPRKRARRAGKQSG